LLITLEKITHGDFFETLHSCQPQKAWFLRPAHQGDFFETYTVASA
jgi:hypothetical protein